MKRKLVGIVLLALAGGVCLMAVFAGWLATRLPRQAERAFGSPAGTLGAVQQLLLSAQLLAQQRELLTPLDPGGPPQPFRIELGESTYAITDRLQSEGLVADADLLRTFLVYSGLDTTIQAGQYTLSARMTPVEIAQALQDATPSEVTFIVLAGWRLEEVAAALPTSGLSFSPQDFLAYARQPSLAAPLISSLPAGTSLEGFLLPDRYELPRDTGVQAFVQIMVENFDRRVGPDLRQGFMGQGLDLYQAVTLASIVEREAVLDEEMPLIASVFLNRLAAGMRLDSDPTIQYALGQVQSVLPGAEPGKMTWWKNPLSLEDLQVDSPYNTYRATGLPPAPIANPGLSALEAVAHPAQTPYYYFRAACDDSGKHVFAETFEQHQQNACP
jgi:UPF0755 protein